jgi:hypothetical protein
MQSLWVHLRPSKASSSRLAPPPVTQTFIRRFPVLFALIVAVSALPGPSSSAPTKRTVTCSRFAAPGGNDGSRGGKSRPFATPQRLADSLRPGQTGCLRGGTYQAGSNGYVLRPRHGGAPSAPITIRSYPGERAKLVGIIYLAQGSNYVTLSALGIEGTGEENTVQITSDHDIVEDSSITNAWRGNSCMILGDTSGAGAATLPIIRRNRFHECGNPHNGAFDHAIYASNMNGGQIVDNLFWNTSALTIQLYPNAHHVRFAHNVVDGDAPSVRGGVFFGGDSDYASSDNVVEYNVIAYAQTFNIDSSWDGATGSNNIARRNCLWAGREGNINTEGGGFSRIDNKVANPLFVNKTKHDYRLKPRSPCRRVVGFDTAALLRAHAMRPVRR